GSRSRRGWVWSFASHRGIRRANVGGKPGWCYRSYDWGLGIGDWGTQPQRHRGTEQKEKRGFLDNIFSSPALCLCGSVANRIPQSSPSLSQKILRQVHPSPVEAVFISRGGPHRFHTVLHLLRRFAFAPQFIKRHATPVARPGVGGASAQKLVEHFKRVLELPGVVIDQAGLAPDFILAVRRVQLHDPFEIPDGVVQASLLARDAPELVMRVDFPR